MKTIIIARVSTLEQKEAGNSLPAQIARMQSYCERNSFIITHEFSFDESAYKTKRDEFDKIIETIKNSKEKLAVCFDKVDRLSRNIFDKRVAWLYEKAISNEIELHFVSDAQVINDKMSAGDKFAFGMKLGLSKYYSDAISDNVKRALEQKRKNGEWPGMVRIGYSNIPLDQENRTRKDIVIDPEKGHLVKKLFELYSTGNYSLEALRQKITDAGLRTRNNKILTKSGVENIINDSFYCGIAMSKKHGNYNHKYPRLISRELFDLCQQIREGRRNRPSKIISKDFIFKGLLKCKNCGCVITAQTKIKKSGLSFTYYSCTNGKGICQRIYTPEKVLLDPIYELLDKFSDISEQLQTQLIDEIRKNTEDEVVFQKAQIDRIRNEYDMLKKRQDSLLDAYLDHSITKEVYDKKNTEIQNKIEVLELEMGEHSNADFEYKTTVSKVVFMARHAKAIFETSSEPAQKRAFLNFVLENPTLDGKKLYFSIASPFNLLLELNTCPNWLPRQDSNLRPYD